MSLDSVGLRVLVYAFAAVNAGIGVAALVAPRRLGSWLGYELTSTTAYGEMRAVYGGLFLALGVGIALALHRTDGAGWLYAFAVLYAGLAVGRLTSAVLDGPVRYTLAALAVEVGGVALLLVAAARFK